MTADLLGYRMHLWIALMFIIGLVDISNAIGCKSARKLVKMNVTADMTYGDTLDNFNNKPEFANLNENRAFCAKIQPGFYIQVNLGAPRTITALEIQGFKFNGTNYKIPAFTLEFSLDGNSWYQYVYGGVPKYFLVKDVSGSDGTVSHIAAIGQYVRVYPRSSSTDEKKKIMCIRFDMYGCNKVAPPSISSTKHVETRIAKEVKLSCSTATGMVSMVLEWKNHSDTASNVTVFGKKLKSNLLLKVSFNELYNYKCTSYVTIIKCVRIYTCHSYYMFNPYLQKESKSKVVVNIVLPDLITTFSVAHKNKSGVLLSWKRPALNDLNPSMLNYSLTCNITGFEKTEILPLSEFSVFLMTAKVYHQYQCRLKLVKNNLTRNFPFGFNQTSAILNFRSLSIRPNVKPVMVVHQTSHDTVKLYAKFNFTEEEFGEPKGFVVNATMMEYGNRMPATTWIKDVLNKRIAITNVTNGYVNSLIKVNKLKPWSKYRIQVAVFNDDFFMSNYSSVVVKTKEGKPIRGPALGIHIISKRVVTMQVKTSSSDIIYNNGNLIKYQLMIKPINQTLTINYKKHKNYFDVNGLKPSRNYTFQCRAATKAGFGPYGELLLVTMENDIPSPPYGIKSVGTHNLLIQWKKPVEPHGTITKYEIRVTFNNHTIKFYYVKDELIFPFKFPASSVEQVSIRAYTTAGHSAWSASFGVSSSVTNPYKKQSAMIIGFSVAFGVFVAFVAMCFIYFRRHYRSHPHQIKDDYQLDSMLNSREVHVFDDELESDMYIGSTNSGHSSDTSTCNLAGSTHDPLPVEEFPGYINMVKQDNYKILEEDFKNQMPVGKCYSWHIADLAENIDKNRYNNICAYDHSRIVLKYDGGERKLSDYINANSIYGYKKHEDGRYKYISTQGPMDDTIADFWHMVWQEGCNIIVMLTNLKENDKVKCAQYWPHESSTKVYGKIGVTLDKIDKTADYITRTFQLEQVETKEQRTVRQFHFVPWPDHGVPDYPTALLSLRRRVRHYYEEGKPMIVHCSAGIGRTGCFILIDAMLERIDNEKTVDIFNYLNYMRTRRICMVQTSEQYKFAHTAVLEYITFGNTETFVGELDKKFKELVRGNGMAEEFAVLERNKVSDLRPGNISKVLLREGIFVEAFRVDGFKQRDAFILTKAPSEDNIINFWKMVLEKQCHTIVMLNKCQEVSQEYFKYWPDVDGHNAYQDIAVMLNSEVANGNIMTRKIKVTTNKRRCEVNHFQFVDWPDTDIPDQRDYNNICTLMQAVEKSQHNLGNGPIIVHSGNDYGRSGTFIAIYNSTERLKVEQLIDVLQCVRAIRITQPLAVDNVSQYQFVYNMLRTYLEGFENYCNYKEYNVCRSPFGSTSTSFIS